MTKDEALKLALKALEIGLTLIEDFGSTEQLNAQHKAITAIYEALAQPEHGWTPERIAGMARLKEAQDKKLAESEKEPVAWAKFSAKGNIIDLLNEPDDDYTPLYTTPPQRKPLTDEEIEKIAKPFWDGHLGYGYADFDSAGFARAIEAAHGIKGEA